MKEQIHHILAKTPLLMRVVSLYVVVGMAVGGYMYMRPPAETAPAVLNVMPVVERPVAPEQITGVPRSFTLPRIGLTREVIDGYYIPEKQDWTLTDDKAQFAAMTSPLSDTAGQAMIYGHNTVAVLEPVKNVAVGDELLITSDTGRVFVYTYASDRFVDPTDTSVLYETPGTPRVVLMTCEGWTSATRRLLYFDFKEVR